MITHDHGYKYLFEQEIIFSIFFCVTTKALVLLVIDFVIALYLENNHTLYFSN